jgi:NDMA-dependent alcohol dehydrogenase
VKSEAALCFGPGEPWEIVEIDIDPPHPFEVQVELRCAGLCHSEEHVRNGDLYVPPEVLNAFGMAQAFPIVGGHEGAGVVVAVGEGVRQFEVGDHVAANFVPSCGWCHWCATGRQNLCDYGIYALGGPMISDGTFRYHHQGQPLHRTSQIGTFSKHVVAHENSWVKYDPAISFEVASLVSCGVTTGYGSAVSRGKVRAGEVAVVIGCGGVGSGALFGAKSAGARAVVAVDPVQFKRDHALETGVATHGAPSIEAALPLVRELTAGRMADVVVMTPGLLEGGMIAGAMALASKDGRVVATAMSKTSQETVTLSLLDLATMNKALLGSIFGSYSPRAAIPEILTMYQAGMLDLDSLVTRKYKLHEVNEGYADLLAGTNIRGLVEF